MSTNNSRQLIEHISDQYVLSALDAEQAFAREAQKRKKNRTKLFSIAGVIAAVYALIIVSIIIGTRPDTPPEPPTPGTQGSQNGDGSDVTLPDAEFFQQHLSGFWEPNTSVSEPYPDTDLSSSTSVLNFQSDGRVYIMDLTSSSTTLGKYSVAGDFIQIYTLDAEQTWVQSGKMKIDLQSDQALLQAGSWTYKRITGTETTNLLICGVSESTETEISIWDFYIEDVRFKDHSVHLYVSAAEFFDLVPLRFDSAPTFFVNLVDNVKYKIYDKRMTLLEEGAQKFDIEDNSLSLDLLEEHGLYYIDLSGMYTSSGPIQEVVLHYYLAIQVGEPEPEPDDPVTPPEYTPPEITLPNEPYLDYIRCMSEVYGMWIEGSWAEATVKDVIYYFSPDGYFYEMNIKTWESMMGVYYYYADGTILLFEANEKGDPVRQLPRHAVRSGGNNGVITVINTEDDKTLGTYTLGNTMPTTELLRVEIDKKSYLIPHMFPESFVWDKDHKFEFDTAFFVDKMQSVTHLTVTEAPILYIPLQGEGATYTLYIKEPGTSTLEVLDEGVLIQEHGKMTLPDISGLYWDDEGVCLYLDIRFETGGYNAYCNQQFMHYFVALRCGEEEEVPSYTPPVLDDDRDILPIVNCDVKPGGMFTLDTTSPAEGKGCWSTAMAPAIAFQKLETAINATGCDVIEFDLYISDLGALEVMKQNCALELSSGGQSDVQEIAFSGQQIIDFGRYGQEWKVGWNRVVLRLSDATPTNGDGKVPFDISNINYVRFYLLSASSGHTIKIDNICLSGKVTASAPTTTPPTLERLSEKECFSNLVGIWSCGELGQEDTYPIWYVFSPDGYFHVYDAQKNEGQMGVYSFDGSNIGLWLKDESGKWYQSETKMTLDAISSTQKNLQVTDKDGTVRQYQSTAYERYPVLGLVTFDTPSKLNMLQRQTMYHTYLGGIRTSQGKYAAFELPSIGILYQTQPINVTDLTELTQFWIASMAGVTDYTATFTAYAPLDNGKFVIEESGEIDLHPDYCVYSLAEIFNMSYDLYFVDICFEVPAPGDVGTLVWHYYVALQHGNSESEQPVTPPVATTSPVEIFDCDTLPDYHGDFELDQTNMVEGDGCISITVTGTTYTIMDLTFDPINAEGCDVLEFDLYISDPTLFQSGRFFTIELSSSVKQNTAELSFFGAGFFGLDENLELKQGWNHVKIPLSEGKLQSIEEQGFDLGAINHLHIFLIENIGAPNGAYTVKIDNICLSANPK